MGVDAGPRRDPPGGPGIRSLPGFLGARCSARVPRGAAARADTVSPEKPVRRLRRCSGHYITVNYRESYNLFVRVSGILFQPLNRPGAAWSFVTRKVSDPP